MNDNSKLLTKPKQIDIKKTKVELLMTLITFEGHNQRASIYT